MWILTTRGRPAMCQEVLDACESTGMTTPGLVYVDGPVNDEIDIAYLNLRLPKNWTVHYSSVHTNIGEAMRWFQKEYPDLPWYGWMADDCPPRSSGWDLELIKAAGKDCISYPNDDWQQGKKDRDGTPHVTSIICLGGEFVRALPCWVLSGMVQMYIDDYWESVAVPANRMRYQEHVFCEHRHFANGKRPRDATDTRQFKGRHFPADDHVIYQLWLMSDERKRAIASLC